MNKDVRNAHENWRLSSILLSRTLLIGALFAAGNAWPQAETRPARPTTPSSGLPASPSTPGLPGSPSTPTLPGFQGVRGPAGFTNATGNLFTNQMAGFTNQFASLTNQFGTNFISAEFGFVLADLQNNLERLLPLLAALNFPTEQVSAVPQTTGVNFSGNASVDASSSLGANAGANLAVPVGPPPVLPPTPPTGAIGTNAAAGALLPPSATGLTDATGLPPGFNPAVPTNVVLNTGALNTMNALAMLRSDIQRMLPLVAALSGRGVDSAELAGLDAGSLDAAVTNRIATSTNTLGTADRTLPASSPSRLLTPTTTPPRTSDGTRP